VNNYDKPVLEYGALIDLELKENTCKV